MTLDDFSALLAASKATDAFRTDLAAYIARQPAERITAPANNPRVKVLRTIAQLLHSEPHLAIERVAVRGESGCAEFAGKLTATTSDSGVHDYEFEWNCEWKARQLGYVDGFGFPDQIRAAQEFEWRCFQHWTPVLQDAENVA
jgi:hypothetical protein